MYRATGPTTTAPVSVSAAGRRPVSGSLRRRAADGTDVTDLDTLPSDWTVWSDEDDGSAVVAYRPDVFDSEAFPPECLPTLYLTRGRHRNRPRPRGPAERGVGWHVTLYLEPDVEYGDHPEFDTRSAAVEGLIEIARRFADGDLDYRACYQHPRPDYLDRLDELTGTAAGPDS